MLTYILVTLIWDKNELNHVNIVGATKKSMEHRWMFVICFISGIVESKFYNILNYILGLWKLQVVKAVLSFVSDFDHYSLSYPYSFVRFPTETKKEKMQISLIMYASRTHFQH